MRGTFITGLVDLAAADERIVLLTGDLGYTVIEPFADRFPERFFNVGVAEQNMIGVATGLAEAGFIPFAYSIATFASLRAYEFIRNGPVAHHLPVRIVGVGGGFEYGSAGFTHHALEDLAVMRVLPEMTVIAPADARQAGKACVGASLPRLSRVISRLESAGFVARSLCPEDRRATNVTLTEAGWAKVVAAAPGHVGAVRGFVLDALTAEQVAQLSAISAAMLKRLDPDGRMLASEA